MVGATAVHKDLGMRRSTDRREVMFSQWHPSGLSSFSSPATRFFLCLLVLFNCSFSDSTWEQQKHWGATILSVWRRNGGGVMRPRRPKVPWWYGTILLLFTPLFFQHLSTHLKCPLVRHEHGDEVDLLSAGCSLTIVLVLNHLLFGSPFSLWTSHPHE